MKKSLFLYGGATSRNTLMGGLKIRNTLMGGLKINLFLFSVAGR